MSVLSEIFRAIFGPDPVHVSQKAEDILTQKALGRIDLDWRGSIVDLLKVLDLDSSLNARKTLAAELNYHGSLDGSAEMNQWLHAEVMKRVGQGKM